MHHQPGGRDYFAPVNIGPAPGLHAQTGNGIKTAGMTLAAILTVNPI
jgi:hypothetical protein